MLNLTCLGSFIARWHYPYIAKSVTFCYNVSCEI